MTRTLCVFLFLQHKYRRVQLIDSDDDEEEQQRATEGDSSLGQERAVGDLFGESDEEEDGDHESLKAVEPDGVSTYGGRIILKILVILVFVHSTAIFGLVV